MTRADPDQVALALRTSERPGHLVVEAPRGSRVGAFVRGLVVGVLALVGLLVVASRLVSLDLNPFDARTTERSQPPLLLAVQDLSRYTAAEGSFQVVIDLQEDRSYVPDFLLGERTLFVAAGSVDSYVDFGDLDDGAVEVDETDQVRITLPEPVLGDAALDLDASYVVDQQRGLLDRVGDAFGDDADSEREVYQLAERRIAEAAVDTELVDRAEGNTRQMLTGLLRSLGYTDVTVDFT